MLEGAIGFKPTLTVDTGFLASVKKNQRAQLPFATKAGM